MPAERRKADAFDEEERIPFQLRQLWRTLAGSPNHLHDEPDGRCPTRVRQDAIPTSQWEGIGRANM
jgi:hypothetical protein